MNNTISYSSLRANLKSTLDEVCNAHNPILVTRKNGDDIVIVSKSDFESLEETNYLLSSIKNRERLDEALNRKKKERISISNITELNNEIRNRSTRS